MKIHPETIIPGVCRSSRYSSRACAPALSSTAASSAPAGEGLEEYTVPAFTWAVFPGTGEGAPAVQALERRVVTEWLPASGYESAEGPDVEVYLNPECTQFEVWIPVVKAKG